ncbi:MAG: ABC transporter permease [Lachnospiraceae bacterium]|nr:ABC transporter permease [Lachnospiraceae bacterium]
MKAFLRKEWMENLRTGRLLILGIIFFIFGLMNPAIAKLTPWLMENMKDSITDTGIEFGEVTISAMTSWTQFYKNTPMCVIVIVLMLGGIFVNEYQKGTLVQVVTKGLSRRKIFFSKMVNVYGLWTLMYLVYFGVTYGYTVYFWPEDKVESILFGAFCYWLFGMILLAFLLLFSAIADNVGQVLLGVGAVVAAMFFLNYVPKLQKYLLLRLTEGLNLSLGSLDAEDFVPAVIISCISVVICSIMGMALFDKRDL